MRTLTKKQKEFLVFKAKDGAKSWEDLSWEEQQKMEQLNDTEIIVQETDRFLSDLYFQGQNNEF